MTLLIPADREPRALEVELTHPALKYKRTLPCQDGHLIALYPSFHIRHQIVGEMRHERGEIEISGYEGEKAEAVRVSNVIMVAGFI